MISHLPSKLLMIVISSWPFQQWGLDILGPLPIGRGQCKFIFVVLDYFTKWAEVSRPEPWSDPIGESEPIFGMRDHVLGLFT